jgi:hypothetical protein
MPCKITYVRKRPGNGCFIRQQGRAGEGGGGDGSRMVRWFTDGTLVQTV